MIRRNSSPQKNDSSPKTSGNESFYYTECVLEKEKINREEFEALFETPAAAGAEGSSAGFGETTKTEL